MKRVPERLASSGEDTRRVRRAGRSRLSCSPDNFTAIVNPRPFGSPAIAPARRALPTSRCLYLCLSSSPRARESCPSLSYLLSLSLSLPRVPRPLADYSATAELLSLPFTTTTITTTTTRVFVSGSGSRPRQIARVPCHRTLLYRAAATSSLLVALGDTRSRPYQPRIIMPAVRS